MVQPQRLLPDRERPFVEQLDLAVLARSLQSAPRLLRLMATSGWSGPSAFLAFEIAAGRFPCGRRAQNRTSPLARRTIAVSPPAAILHIDRCGTRRRPRASGPTAPRRYPDAQANRGYS